MKFIILILININLFFLFDARSVEQVIVIEIIILSIYFHVKTYYFKNLFKRLGQMKFRIKYNFLRNLMFYFILPKKGIGMEIGVWEGKGSKALLRLTNPKKLYLVDPYREDLIKRLDGLHISQRELNDKYEKVKDWAKDHKIYFFRLTSAGTLRHILDEYLDWIYIDGNHWDVYNDLTWWYDKVKKGGIIMGDDYTDKFPEVIRDVNRFCSESDIKFRVFNKQYWFTKC